MRKLFVLLVAVSLVISFCASAFATTKWIANSVWPPKNHHSIGLNMFAKKVKERTGGKLIIKVYVGGALGYKGPELLKVVRDGLVQVSDMLFSGVAGDEPVFGVTTLPFLVCGFKEARLLMDIGRPYFEELTQKKWNQKILYTAPWPPAGLWTKKPVKCVADMKGLKTRTYDKNGALVVKATGGTPYALPFSEVYSALATGLIDSVITSTPTAVDGKFWEVLKYFERINITQAADMVNVNLRAFNKLDKDTQKVLLETGKEMESYMWNWVEKLDKEKEKECNEHGIVSIPVSEEFMNELSKITEKIRKDWLKTAPPQAKEIYHKFLEKVGRKD
ncbi:MAG: TRAP transporter substrate-binding protein [Synergistetes bacterium]|nr:TRAP transporter substrate-binding protein [Synergistota bacterium]